MSFDDFGGWKQTLLTLTAGSDLSRGHCRAVLGEMLTGNATDAQIAAFLAAMRLKGESADELAGLHEAMMAAAEPLRVPDHTIDIVGVGGGASRRQHALNVSTMASFVAAGAGAVVCKHGNRKASSTSGSFDVLDALGIATDVSPATLEQAIAQHGVGFAFARTFHPAMRHVGPARTQMGIPTVFNLLGPLSHPGHVKRQVIGVSDWSMAPRMADALRATGSVCSMVVHGDGGLDELSTTGVSRYLLLNDETITEHEVDGVDFGLARVEMDDLAGGDASTNATIAESVLSGQSGPARDIVCLNAAAGLVVAGVVDDLAAGVVAAQGAIDDGRAMAKLNSLRS